MATAKLAQLMAEDFFAGRAPDPDPPSRSRTPVPIMSDPPSPPARVTSAGVNPEETVTVARAIRVNRLDSPSHPSTHVPSPSLSRVAQPIHVPTRSLGSAESFAAALVAASTTAPLRPAPTKRKTSALKRSSWRKRAFVTDSGVGSDSSMSSSWLTIEDALNAYKAAIVAADGERAKHVSETLLPFLKRAETPSSDEAGPVLATGPLGRRQRAILFGWLDTLEAELRDTPANRGACLEGVAAMLESRYLAAEALVRDQTDQERYTRTLIGVLAFAVERLNEKAVYANTLAFSGRMLALAFFRLEGVGLKLLRLLPQVKRQDLKRVAQEAGIDWRCV